MRTISRVPVLVAIALLAIALLAPSLAYAAEPALAPAAESSDADSSEAIDETDGAALGPSEPVLEADSSDDAELSDSEGIAEGAAESAEGSVETEASADGSSEASVSYRTHVQEIGWQEWKQDGDTAGTSGQSLRLEAIEFALEGPYEGEIFCQAHVEDIGWQRLQGTSVGDGPAMVGTSGRSLRMEALKFTLAGEISRWYDIVYRAHVQDIGWQDWVSNGGMAGTSGRSLRIEALELKLVSKAVQTEASDGDPSLVYSAHVEERGWQTQKASGEIAGTTGHGLRLEAATIWLDPAALEGSIEYRAHVQYVGWQDWVANGELAGTTGESLRMEAFQIRLTGDIADRYDIVYRAHVEYTGWQPWAVNGAMAGTTGESLRMEALRIALIAKGIFEIPEGSYLISRADSVATSAVANGDGTFATSNNCVDTNKKFYIREAGEGTYTIQAMDSLMFLSDGEGGLSQAAFAVDDTHQLWSASWDNGAVLTNLATGKVLTIAPGSVTTEALDPASASQRLAISDSQLISDGMYLIANAETGLVLDVYGASWDDGANVVVHVPNGGGNQVFTVLYEGDNVYTITCAMTEKALDVAGGSTADGTNVHQWRKNTSGAQRWMPRFSIQGSYEFVNVSSGKHLAFAGDGGSGANVMSSDATPETNRQWVLTPTSYRPDYVLERAIRIAAGEGSATDYLILVDLTENRTVVFEWRSGGWEPIKNWVCSTGAPWSPTVLGDYQVTGKGYSFNGALGGTPYTCYYYTQFYGDYLFHSVPYHQGTWDVQDDTLGESVSHGCVRLATENAKWIYDNIPYRTHVLTYY